MEQRRPKIIIIGAGLAGLSAAQRLISKGFNNIQIVEAKDRIGGRVLTQRYGGSYIEIGAQWIHGEGSNPIYQIALQNGLLQDENGEEDSDDDDDKHLFYTQHGQLVPSKVVDEANSVLDQILDYANKFSRENIPSECRDDSIGMYAREAFHKHLQTKCQQESIFQLEEAIFNWKMVVEKTENGCRSADELSLYSWGQYLEYEGSNCVVLKHGYESILHMLVVDIPEEYFMFSKQVTNIEWPGVDRDIPDEGTRVGSMPLQITLQDGEILAADFVIFTCSLGVLKAKASCMFSPSLPEEKLMVIDRMGFGTVNKIYLEFEQPFWDKDTGSIQLTWLPDSQPFFLKCVDNKHIEKFGEWYRGIHGFDVVDHHSNLLCGWIAGTEAEIMEQIDENVVAEVCHELLTRFTGLNNILKPKKITRSRWRSDPEVCGSYTYIMAGNTALDCDTLAQPLPDPRNPCLLFAGEATSRNYFSTTHGALLSGQREADRIIEHWLKTDHRTNRQGFPTE